MPKWAMFCRPQLVTRTHNGTSNQESNGQWPDALISTLNRDGITYIFYPLLPHMHSSCTCALLIISGLPQLLQNREVIICGVCMLYGWYCTCIGGGSGTASTATAVPKFDKWGLSRTKLGSEQFQYQPVGLLT